MRNKFPTTSGRGALRGVLSIKAILKLPQPATVGSQKGRALFPGVVNKALFREPLGKGTQDTALDNPSPFCLSFAYTDHPRRGRAYFEKGGTSS